MGNKFTCYIIGSSSLLIRCASLLLERGHTIYGIITSTPKIKDWAIANGLPVVEYKSTFAESIQNKPFDYLFSITNLEILPPNVLDLPHKGAINFHDGPLPRYAGMHATTWAIMNGEKSHGITWHEMTRHVDGGDVLKQKLFVVEDNETALSLNAKCFEAGVSGFEELVDELAAGIVKPIKQSLDKRCYFAKYKRPENALLIDWNQRAEDVCAFVRSLDFGRYENPVGQPKIKIGDSYFYLVPAVKITDAHSTVSPGIVSAVSDEYIRVATSSNDVEFTNVFTIEGLPVSLTELSRKHGLRAGSALNRLDNDTAKRISVLNESLAPKEKYWVKHLTAVEGIDIYYADKNRIAGADSCFKEEVIPLQRNLFDALRSSGSDPALCIASAFGIFIGRHSQKDSYTLGLSNHATLSAIKDTGNLFAKYVPVTIAFDSHEDFSTATKNIAHCIKQAIKSGTFIQDIFLRYPELHSYTRGNGGPAYSVSVVLIGKGNAYKLQKNNLLTLIIPHDLDSLKLVYDSSVISDEKLTLLKSQFIVFLEDAILHPETKVGFISILSSDEKKTLLTEWNNTKMPYTSDKSIHQLFEEQVKRTLYATAVYCSGESISYIDLSNRSNQLAQKLRKIGVGLETLVGIYLHRSLDMMISVLGVLKAGGAYVPLDPDFPIDRILYMIQDSKCPVIITQREMVKSLESVNAKLIVMDDDWEEIRAESESGIESKTTAENLAYVIYTSGSTGKPKGVMVQHGNVVNFFTGMDMLQKIGKPGVWLAVTSLSFDISVFELLWTLTRGFKIVIYDGRHEKKSANRNNFYSIPDLMKDHTVTHLQCTPSMAKMLLLNDDAKREIRKLEYLMIGGETFPKGLAAELSEIVSGKILNMYGPTETTIWSTVFTLDAVGDAIPIGRPVANTTIYLLDDNNQLVPVGAPGELCIGGEGVARGYLNKPELTAERFIQNPFDETSKGGKIYKTGDYARYRPDGTIEFLGRRDLQVKIRGYRIELGEIESRLSSHPHIREATVIAREDSPGDTRLIAYFVPENEQNPDKSMLKEFMKAKLPEYMVPAQYISMSAFPLTPNGKIDRKAFPAPCPGESPVDEKNFVMPSGDREIKIASIWRSLLKLDKVGIKDNFFDIGGHSLLAVQLHATLKQEIDDTLTLIDLFRFPTIRSLVAYLENKSAPDSEILSPGISKRAILLKKRRANVRSRVKGNS